MIKVVLREGETLDDLLRRFKRDVNKSGVLYECRKREFFMSPADMFKFKKQNKGKKK